ncbi:MAG: flagellar assembly protein H [Rubrivivax sp.]|nr:MAG: flagellar assembly protein H [Rubrivivax sp.]
MKTLRPHRFPPLAQVSRASSLLDGQSGAQLQASLAQGFQEGLAKGYEEGYASGLQTGTAEARSAAEASGHAAGLAAGREDARALLVSPVAAVDTLLTHLCKLQQDYQSAMRREVVELVERVARQVIRAELTLRPTQLMALVDETLSSMPPTRDGVEVFLNPEDRQRLLELGPERVHEWTLHADASLDPGECRVIAGGREADAGCRQRLAACMDQVRGQLMPETTIDGEGGASQQPQSSVDPDAHASTAAGAFDALGATGEGAR